MSLKDINLSRDQIAAFCGEHKIREFAVFGSVITDNFSPDSDIDVLVTFAEDCGYSLFDLAEIKQELEKIVGRPVDLVEKQSLRNPFRKYQILNNMEVLYAA